MNGFSVDWMPDIKHTFLTFRAELALVLGKAEGRKFMKARDVVAAVDLNLYLSTILQSAFLRRNIFRDIEYLHL